MRVQANLIFRVGFARYESSGTPANEPLESFGLMKEAECGEHSSTQYDRSNEVPFTNTHPLWEETECSLVSQESWRLF